MITLEKGKSIEMIPGKFCHRCFRCGKYWISNLKEPKRCKLCNSPYWREAVTRQSVSDARKK